jgi:hypothetical protein
MRLHRLYSNLFTMLSRLLFFTDGCTGSGLGERTELGSLVKALFDDACAPLLDRRRVRHRLTLRVRYRNLIGGKGSGP